MSPIAVVIPARDEQGRVGAVVKRVRSEADGSTTSVYVVDDGSQDGTAAVAREAGARVLRHRVNLGKGAALLTGAEAAVKAGAQLLVLMDADGQHDPGDLSRLLEPIQAGRADLVLGYRLFTREMPAAMRLGNTVLSGLFATLFGVTLRDTQCGYRAVTAKALGKLRWSALDYAVETEMLVHAARAGLRIEEVPIATVYHDRYKGTTPVDGLRILANMLRWRLA